MNNTVKSKRLEFGIAVFFVLLLAVFGGCTITDIMITPLPSEEVIPAEFDLNDTEGRLLVYVEQPAWIKSPVDLRIPMTKMLNISFKEKAKIGRKRIIEYAEIVKAKMKMSPEDRRDPFILASQLSASYVLFVEVIDFDLSTFAERNFYNGSFKAKACLFGVNRERLWPDQDGCREVLVGIDAQSGELEEIIDILTSAEAHCISRYFYDCQKGRFNIAEEKRYENYTW